MAQNRQYEIVYIVAPTASEQELADVQAQVESAAQRYGGAIEKTENWGRRKLAYEIGRHKEGTYVLHVVNGPGEMVKEIERRLRVFDYVIRYLAVRIDEDMRMAERAQAERKAETARRRTARGLPPEPEPVVPSSIEDEGQQEEAEV
ncbi:MAG TPA: 30S ribosomal protein S6 [Vicinamibacterales bacterium]|nr:30S ribosomal protein S6 [Vicinamibacterales bacterium]